MKGKELVKWGRLHRRRKASIFRRKVFSLPMLSLMSSFLLAFECARRLGPIDLKPTHIYMAQEMKGLWLDLLFMGVLILMLKIPSELFWREDSAFLARLPISGRSHFYVAFINTVRRAMWLFLPMATTIAVYSLYSKDVSTSVKQWIFSFAILLCTVFWGLAAAVLAGVVVASNKLQASIGAMVGEFQAPKTSWLGVVPGMVGTLCLAAAIGGSGWSVGESIAFDNIVFLLLPLLIFGFLGFVWAYWVSEKELANAIREVAALDRDILAYVEKAGPSKLEMLTSRLFSSSFTMSEIIQKDATLTRRRYPLPLFLFVLFIGLFAMALWLGHDFLKNWGTLFLLAEIATVVFLSLCVLREPIENMRFLRTLPIAEVEILKTKMALGCLRVFLMCLLICVPWVILSRDIEMPLEFFMVALTMVLGSSLLFFKTQSKR